MANYDHDPDRIRIRMYLPWFASLDQDPRTPYTVISLPRPRTQACRMCCPSRWSGWWWWAVPWAPPPILHLSQLLPVPKLLVCCFQLLLGQISDRFVSVLWKAKHKKTHSNFLETASKLFFPTEFFWVNKNFDLLHIGSGFINDHQTPSGFGFKSGFDRIRT